MTSNLPPIFLEQDSGIDTGRDGFPVVVDLREYLFEADDCVYELDLDALEEALGGDLEDVKEGFYLGSNFVFVFDTQREAQIYADGFNDAGDENRNGAVALECEDGTWIAHSRWFRDYGEDELTVIDDRSTSNPLSL